MAAIDYLSSTADVNSILMSRGFAADTHKGDVAMVLLSKGLLEQFHFYMMATSNLHERWNPKIGKLSDESTNDGQDMAIERMKQLLLYRDRFDEYFIDHMIAIHLSKELIGYYTSRSETTITNQFINHIAHFPFDHLGIVRHWNIIKSFVTRLDKKIIDNFPHRIHSVEILTMFVEIVERIRVIDVDILLRLGNHCIPYNQRDRLPELMRCIIRRVDDSTPHDSYIDLSTPRRIRYVYRDNSIIEVIKGGGHFYPVIIDPVIELSRSMIEETKKHVFDLFMSVLDCVQLLHVCYRRFRTIFFDSMPEYIRFPPSLLDKTDAEKRDICLKVFTSIHQGVDIDFADPLQSIIIHLYDEVCTDVLEAKIWLIYNIGEDIIDFFASRGMVNAQALASELRERSLQERTLRGEAYYRHVIDSM